MSEAQQNTSDVPNEKELIARARNLIPLVAEHAERGEQAACVAPEVIAELKNAGLYKVLQPRRWGGYEMSPGVIAEIQIALAEGDMSTAWVYGVMGCHNFQAALFDDAAARDVWERDSTAIISSAFPADVKIETVEGGYHFQGRWVFSSGCEHADWIYVGALHDGDFLTCLVPAQDYTIQRNWNVVGLKGTGSHELVLEDVFVPAYRVHKSADGFRCDSPGNAVHTAPLYRIPFHQVFIRAITNGCIGGLQGLLNSIRDYAKTREGVVIGKRANDPDTQKICGEAEAAIDEMKVVLHRNFERLMRYAQDGLWPPPYRERLLYKYQSAVVAERCLDLARELFKASGSAGIFASHPFGRIYRDMIAVRQHVASQSQLTARSIGSVGLGLDVEEWYL